jgi:lauroyl/myristoyl acyltransferase
VLERGDVVFLFFDMPGSHQTHFLGKPAMLADGTARLAFGTDAIVLPLRSRSAGHRVSLDVGAPLDPHDFADVSELHAALAGLHERWILESPQAMADPRSFGWGAGATPREWSRPASDGDSSRGGELAAT